MNTISDRIDAITGIPPEKMIPRLPAPNSVKIELTGICNFKCYFCATAQGLREVGNMDFGLYKRLVREMRDEGVNELGLFFLGESFLYKQLPEAIRFAKEECGYPYVFLTTNGRVATPDKVRACMEAGLDSLKFSFNSADEEQCFDVTKIKGSFDPIVANIKAAHKVREEVKAETGHACGLFASSIQYDGEQQKRMETAAEAIKPYVDEHYWLPLYNQAGFVSDEEAERGLKPSAGNRGRLEALRPPLPCWTLFTEGHISWDGKLTGCCFSHTPDFDFGDLKEMAFMDAWNSQAAQELRTYHLRGNVDGTACQSCFKVE